MEEEDVHHPPQIGPYKFFGVVGTGAFSVVKLVKNLDKSMFYACKIVPKSRLSSHSLLARFEEEIRVNQQLHHPGIVEFADILIDNENFYVVMEFCPNGELFQFIVDRGSLTEEEARPLLRQILETIEFVHSMGVSHRDLKPENLLIGSDGKIKISDFGLSTFLSKEGLVNTPCGSPCYASPECISGMPYSGVTTDVWSIGVILYAMLTGQLPWTKKNQAQLFKQIRTGDFVIPDFLEDDAADMVRGLMTVDSRKRFTIKEALTHPFLTKTPIQFNLTNFAPRWVSLRTIDKFFNRDVNDFEYSLDKDANASCTTFDIKRIQAIITRNLTLPPILPLEEKKPKTKKSQQRNPVTVSTTKLNDRISRISTPSKRVTKRTVTRTGTRPVIPHITK